MGFKLVRIDATEPCKIPLPVGTHILGRGKFLECHDHRVSRMHGKLQVTDDAVTITSLHQNPCFFRKKGVSTINILPHNKFIELNNGDQFGLIPDGFWYELIYCIENVQLQPGPDVTPFMRPVKSEVRPEPSGSGSIGDSSQSSEVRAAAVTPSISQDSSTGSQDTIISDQDSASPNKRAHPDTQSYNMKKPKTEPSSPARQQYKPNTPTNQDSSETDDQDLSENTQAVSNNDENSSESTQAIRNNDQNSSDSTLMDPNIIPKNEPNNEDSFNNGSDTNESSENVKQEPESPGNVKQEPECPGNVKQEPESSQNMKAGPSRDQQVGQMPAACGGDNAAPANNARPRERCMYGESCYRVNPVHKAQFSHPSDADWDAERVCVLGAACRNLRPAHWLHYAHPPPAHPHPQRRNRHGIRVVQRHGNIFYINANSVHFYDDHFQVQDEDGESVDYDYEF